MTNRTKVKNKGEQISRKYGSNQVVDNMINIYQLEN